jgi:ABC-type sugar transport system ATPase subunit
MAQISIEHVTKRFGAVTAVDDLSLTVPDQAFLALLGPSGCGKTTALRCVAGLEQPSGGAILIDGQPVTHLAPQQRDIAMVFQNYALYPHLTARQNLAYPLAKRRLSKAEIDTRVARVADLLQIAHLLDRRPRALSGGEQQRVALGRAIVREPRVFLMDEPLSNLDTQLRLAMRTELKGLQQELGVTTIFVTHDQGEALTMADWIAVMERGRLQQLDTPQALYQRPANLFVAGFVGSPPMNILSGQLEHDAYRLWCVGQGYRLDITDWAARHALPNDLRTLAIGVRPEHLLLRAPTPDSALIGEVYVSEPLGSEVIVNLRVGAALLKARTAPDVVPARGACFAIVCEPQRLHGFNPTTGRRIAEVARHA